MPEGAMNDRYFKSTPDNTSYAKEFHNTVHCLQDSSQKSQGTPDSDIMNNVYHAFHAREFQFYQGNPTSFE